MVFEKLHAEFRGGFAGCGEEHIEHESAFFRSLIVEREAGEHGGIAELVAQRDARGVDEVIVVEGSGPQERDERGHAFWRRMGGERFGGVTADECVTVVERRPYRFERLIAILCRFDYLSGV